MCYFKNIMCGPSLDPDFIKPIIKRFFFFRYLGNLNTDKLLDYLVIICYGYVKKKSLYLYVCICIIFIYTEGAKEVYTN